MNLSVRQREILNHRLEAIEFFGEQDCRELFEASEDDVTRVAKALQSSEHWQAVCKEHGEELVKRILDDCIDGGTYLAAADSAQRDGEISQAKYLGLCRSADTLAEKVNHFTGGNAVYSEM